MSCETRLSAIPRPWSGQVSKVGRTAVSASALSPDTSFLSTATVLRRVALRLAKLLVTFRASLRESRLISSFKNLRKIRHVLSFLVAAKPEYHGLSN